MRLDLSQRRRYSRIVEARKVPASVYPKKEIVLRVVLGPQDDEFTEAGVKSFFWNSGVITNEFDRMGCRIEREAD